MYVQSKPVALSDDATDVEGRCTPKTDTLLVLRATRNVTSSWTAVASYIVS
jgi:hypothetical protein